MFVDGGPSRVALYNSLFCLDWARALFFKAHALYIISIECFLLASFSHMKPWHFRTATAASRNFAHLVALFAQISLIYLPNYYWGETSVYLTFDNSKMCHNTTLKLTQDLLCLVKQQNESAKQILLRFFFEKSWGKTQHKLLFSLHTWWTFCCLTRKMHGKKYTTTTNIKHGLNFFFGLQLPTC